MDGREYHHVCPAEIYPLFARYFEAGLKVHKACSNLERLDGDLSAKEKSLLDDELKEKERNRLQRQIKALDRERKRLLDDLYYIEQRFDELWREVHPSR